jgi:hypothetical protein
MIDEGDCGAIGGMKIGRGNRSTRRNLPQRHFVHHKVPHDQTRARTRAAAVGSQRLTAWAMARSYIPAWSWRTFNSDANLFTLLFSWILQCVISYIFTNVSEETAAFIFRVHFVTSSLEIYYTLPDLRFSHRRLLSSGLWWRCYIADDILYIKFNFQQTFITKIDIREISLNTEKFYFSRLSTQCMTYPDICFRHRLLKSCALLFLLRLRKNQHLFFQNWKHFIH